MIVRTKQRSLMRMAICWMCLPYRLVGKITMGCEIPEQLNWQVPDVIFYPAGGGTGLIGVWKAFHELKFISWLSSEATFPRMIAVQAANCMPLVETYAGRQANAQYYVGKAYYC